MNLKLQLPSNLQAYLDFLTKARTAIVGVLLIALFGYTAYVVNAASNVKTDLTSTDASTKITFDKTALQALQSRNQVSGTTDLGTLGKSDPFSH